MTETEEDYLFAVLIALVTCRYASAVNPVWPIALHLVLLVDKSSGAEEVGSLLRAAVPVPAGKGRCKWVDILSTTFFDLLCTVEQIGVPAVCPPGADIVGMVVGGSAVCVVVAVFALIRVAVFVTIVAHLTFTTIDAVGEVALDVVGVVQQVFLVL